MKFHSQFSLLSSAKSSRLYGEGKERVRLDFYPKMIRVAVYTEGERLFPTYAVCPGTTSMPFQGRERLSNEGLNLLEVRGDDRNIQGDEYSLRIELPEFRIHYLEKGKEVFADRELLAYNFHHEMGKGSFHYLDREEDEHIYGLGDKTFGINKNLHKFRFETFDAMGFNADTSDPLYKQIPFYICRNSKGTYGLFYDTYSNGDVSFGTEINNYYPPYKYVHFEEEPLVFYVFFGDIRDIICHFNYLTGKSFLPPKWSFKYNGSTMAYTDSDHPEQELRNFVKKCQEYQIDCGGFYLSSGYTQIGDNRCVFHWNKEKFPDPQGFASEMKKAGIEFLPNIKPAFLTTHPLYQEIAEKGYFLHYKDGTPALFPFWGGKASYLDFTNKKAFDFWTSCCRKNLVDFGYKALWNDNNEYDIHDDEIYADGFGEEIKAKLIRPVFPMLMNMASYAAMDHSRRHMEVTRSASAGFQRLSETWTGDNRTSFAQFRGNHKMAMTMALTGIAFFGQDIGGFAGEKPSPELFLRWIQYGIFTPRFVLHSWNPDGSSTMPWLYPEYKKEVMRLFALRKKFLPYIYSEAMNAIENYAPLLHPLFLDYPSYDEEADAFFFGNAVLACPVFDEGKKKVEVNLPEDEKGFYRQHRLYKPGHYLIKDEMTDLPVYFIRGGSVVPLEEKNMTVLEIYAWPQGKFTYRFYEDDSSLENTYTEIKVNCTDKEIEVRTSLKYRIRLIDAKKRPLKVIRS